MGFLRIDKERKVVTGLVLEPDEVMSDQEIEQEAYNFMKKYAESKYKKICILESFIFEEDSSINGHEIKKGSWLITAQINDPKKWKLIESGKVNDFSVTLEEEP